HLLVRTDERFEQGADRSGRDVACVVVGHALDEGDHAARRLFPAPRGGRAQEGAVEGRGGSRGRVAQPAVVQERAVVQGGGERIRRGGGCRHLGQREEGRQAPLRVGVLEQARLQDGPRRGHVTRQDLRGAPPHPGRLVCQGGDGRRPRTRIG